MQRPECTHLTPSTICPRSFVSIALLNYRDLRVREIKFSGLCEIAGRMQDVYA